MATRIPEMRILGYQPTRPNLRLLSLPDEAVSPSPVPVNPPAALDHGFLRDGWVVLMPGEFVYGVPLPLEGRSFRVGPWWACVPAVNPRTVWLGRPESARDVPDAPTVVEEYDGVRRETVATWELAPGLALDACVPEGLVFTNTETWTMVLVESAASEPAPLGERGRSIDARGSVLAVSEFGLDPTLRLLDVRTQTSVPVQPPAPLEWGLFGSFSPDGRVFAIPMRDPADHITAEDIVSGDSRDRAHSRLALVDCVSGEVTLADGVFDDFGTAPVWSGDGAWLIFDAPFDKSLFACDLHASPPALVPILRRRGRPGPLVNVTDVVPASA